MSFSWDELQGIGTTLPDGTAIFTVSFAVVGAAGSASPLALVDSPTPREVSVNGALATFNAQNGVVNVITNPVISGGSDSTRTAFELSVPTLNGVPYVVEYADTLPTTNWSTFTTIMGDGTLKTVIDPSLTNHQRFYRARISMTLR